MSRRTLARAISILDSLSRLLRDLGMNDDAADVEAVLNELKEMVSDGY